jgi:hypothetical protein
MSNPELKLSQEFSAVNRTLLWFGLLLAAAVPRIIAAVWLPNEEGDPYSYLRAIEMMRDSIVNGRFTLAELFGFWLPLYQFVSALLSAVFGNPLYVAKLVSALSGAVVCVFVFAISRELTSRTRVSLVMFAVIAFNPIHIMYSSFSMSDVPHASLLVASLYFALRRRWIIAATLIALGGLVRPESWMFIVLLPAVEVIVERRFSIVPLLIALSGPLVWVYISWTATGNPFEYFKVRNDYVQELLTSDPSLAENSISGVLGNLKTLLYSAGPAIVVGCLIALYVFLRRINLRIERRLAQSSLLVALTYFFSVLSFLLVAYFTKHQPAIFARYCLILFALGLPILGWVLAKSKDWRPAVANTFLVLTCSLCFWQVVVQCRDGFAYIDAVAHKRAIAGYLRVQLPWDSGVKTFCDDETVKLLADLPPGSFVSSSNAVNESTAFLNFLEENRVGYLVYENREGSAAVTLFKDLGEERISKLFKPVADSGSGLCVYRTPF